MAMRQQIVDLFATAGKFKMCLSLPGLIEEQILMHGHWEPHLANALSSYMWEGGTFLDIGANIGYHSLFVATACPDSTCIAFEPHPQLYQELESNRKLNGLPNLVTYQKAVGAAAGSADFYMTSSDSYNKGLSSLIPSGPLMDHYTKAIVPVVCLDKVLPAGERDRVKAIKIDAQGYEYEVLCGAKQLIAEAAPVISLEYHNCTTRTLNEIAQLLPGYRMHRIYAWAGGIRPYDPANPAMYTEDLDLLFLPGQLGQP
jgi:FkbM family methyltransferase